MKAMNEMNEDNVGKILDVVYSNDRLDFFQLMKDIELSNEELTGQQFGQDIEIIKNGLDVMYSIASHFVWTLNSPYIANLPRGVTAIFSAFHKNMFAFYSALRLVRMGFYGAARMNMRHIFEALLIAKYCSVSHSVDIYERWKEGDMVYLSKGVLRKIASPDTSAFNEFWGLLSDFTHATVYAQQVSLNIRNIKNDIDVSFIFLRMLLDCQYHLLNTHLITPSMEYYTKRYRKHGYMVPELRKKMRNLLINSNKSLIDRPKEIIRNYKAEWKIIS